MGVTGTFFEWDNGYFSNSWVWFYPSPEGLCTLYFYCEFHTRTHRVTRLASALTRAAHNAAGGQNTQRCAPKATTVLAPLSPAAHAARLPRGRVGAPRRPQPGAHPRAIPASSRRAGAAGRPPHARPAPQQARRTAARAPTGEGGRQPHKGGSCCRAG